MAKNSRATKRDKIAEIIGDPFAEGVEQPDSQGSEDQEAHEVFGPESTLRETPRNIPLDHLIDFENVRTINRNIDELARSIQSQSLIHPILVRPSPAEPGMFDVIAGHRRVEAARLLGWEMIPAVLREGKTDIECVEMGLVENIVRESMTPDEVGRGIRRLINMSDGKLTQLKVAKQLGKDPAYVSGVLKLLEMPQEVQDLVAQEKLKMSHIKALLRLPPEKQISLARKAANNDMGALELSEWVVKELANLPDESPETYEIRESALVPTQLVSPSYKEFPQSVVWRFVLYAALRGFNDYRWMMLHNTHYSTLWEFVMTRSDSEIQDDIMDLGKRYVTYPLSLFAHSESLTDFLADYEIRPEMAIPPEALQMALAQEDAEAEGYDLGEDDDAGADERQEITPDDFTADREDDDDEI